MMYTLVKGVAVGYHLLLPSVPKDRMILAMQIKAALDGHKSMKSVTIVNNDIQIDDPVRVEWAMMTRWQPDKDTIILSNQKGSSLDPSRNSDGLTSKVGFDATIPYGLNPEPFTSIL